MKMTETIIDISTGEQFFREYTEDELAKVEEARAKSEQLAIKSQETLAAKAALLEKLGITEEEAKLLLG